MNKKLVLLWTIAFLLLAACGGGGETEPDTSTTSNDTSTSATTETAEEASVEESTVEESTPEEMEEESAEESNEVDEEDTEEAMENDTSSEAVEEEAAPASPFGSRPLSGVDPETGLTVNPDSVNPGDTFIVRGEIISMNLTPVTSPEFLIQTTDGLKFRLRSQDLAETFYEDGDQLQAYQYRNGLLAQATATLAVDASSSDIPTSTDLVLIKSE